MINSYKRIINYFILLIILTTTTHFFNDFYNIYFRKYEERMIRSYNLCGGISYGYIKKIQDNYLGNEKKIYIVNYDIYPSSLGLFPDLVIDEEQKKKFSIA